VIHDGDDDVMMIMMMMVNKGLSNAPPSISMVKEVERVDLLQCECHAFNWSWVWPLWWMIP
jgi:hypothetical protein